MLCATFPTAPLFGLTVTASKRDIAAIKKSLNLKNPLEVVGKEQYFPSAADAKPKNRLLALYHAPQTTEMKEQVLNDLSSASFKVRLIFVAHKPTTTL